jgi:hypothetical protein
VAGGKCRGFLYWWILSCSAGLPCLDSVPKTSDLSFERELDASSIKSEM